MRLPWRRPDRAKNHTWLTQTPIAHRGLHRLGVPENSLPAFDAAIASGYAIELDVYGLRDGTVAVFHDRGLARLTGRAGQILELTRADLRKHRLLGTDAWIPTLPEVLELVDGRVPLVIEAKTYRGHPSPANLLADALTTYPGPVALQSFDPATLTRLWQRAPRWPRGLLASPLENEGLRGVEAWVLRNLLLSPFCSPTYVGYDIRGLPHSAATTLRALGCPIVAWTVRTPEALERARTVADNIIFEHVTP